MIEHPTLEAQIEAVELAAVRAGETVQALSLARIRPGERPRVLQGAELFRARLEAAVQTLKLLEFGREVAR